MKRILLVSPFPPFIGGVSVSVQRLYEYLERLGYSVARFDTQIRNKKYNRFRPLKLIKYLSLPFFLMFNKRFDIIHFHVSGVMPKLYVSLWRSLFSKKTKFIITIHGQIDHLLNLKYGDQSLSNFDKIICVKQGDSGNIPSRLKSKTVEIPAFIPPDISDDYRYKIPFSLKEYLKRDSFKMLLNGFIIVNKEYKDLYGFKDAILLLEQLRDNGKNADLFLVVIGSDYNTESRDYLRGLKNYCIVQGLENHIFWIEGLTIDLWPLLKAVNVFLRPTKSDGDAMSIREALYLKTPVITSDAVPRPAGTIVYNMNSEMDLLEKTISLIDNYKTYISKIGNNNMSFAQKIIEQYEN